MDALVQEPFSSGQQRACDYNHGSGTITSLHVLGMGQVDHHLGSGVLNFHSLDDGGSVVGDDDVPARGHDHFIHAFWAQASAHSVRDGTRGGDVALAD